jgi:hypothetical protein
MPGKQLQLGRRWRAFGVAAVVAAALPQCSDAASRDHEPPTATCEQQTSYTFECYTLAELQQIAETAARAGGRAQADAGAESGAAGAGGNAATATGPFLLSCPWPDGDIYPPLSGFLDTPPPGTLAASMPGECCYYRTFSFCAGL